MTLVSVVIPAYNQAQYLAETIDSILAQESSSRYEIIVVDDGSTDKTADIATEYGDQIRYIYQSNTGLAGARNTGVNAADGEFVAFLDSDDKWTPRYLDEMLRLATANKSADVYYCGVAYMNHLGELLAQTNCQTVEPDQMYAKLLRGNFLVPSTILMRAEVARKNLSDIAFRRLQDWELWIRLLKKGIRFVGTDQPLIHYRLHEASLSKNATNGQNAAKAIALKHFGEDDGEPETWSPEKRKMYGGVYAYCGLTAALIQAGDWDDCALYVQKALLVDPELAYDVSLFYEISLGTKPLGERGTTHVSDLMMVEMQLKSFIEQIAADPLEASLKQTVKGTSAFALGLLAYHQKKFSFSRKQFFVAVKNRTDLFTNKKLVSHMVKSSLLSMVKG